MRLLLAAIAVLMLSSMALAAPETRQLGPYAVSFNMNTNMNYQVQPFNPEEASSGTAYSVGIFTDNTTNAVIRVTEYKALRDSTLPMYKSLVSLASALRGINVTAVDDKVIDGKNGFLTTGTPVATNAPAGLKVYEALYWLDSKDCECGPVSVGTTSVDIISSYPQDVTQGILNSLHVVKGQAASGGMPPAQQAQQTSQPQMPTQQQMPQQQMPTQQTPGY